MVQISATAPTVYQLGSLRAFKMPVGNHLSGEFTARKEFDTEQEAKNYLKELAENYYFEDGEEVAARHIEGIESHGALTIDAVTAYIEECTGQGEDNAPIFEKKNPY